MLTPLCTYRGHTKIVSHLAWSLDGTRLASASYDGSVQVWHPLTGEPVQTYSGLQGAIEELAWSPEGHVLVTTEAKGSFQLRDCDTSETLLTVRSTLDAVTEAIWSPDRTRIAFIGTAPVGSHEDTDLVQVVEAQTGKLLHTYAQQVELAERLAWSPDNQWIASTDGEESIQVWEANTGRLRRVYEEHTCSIYVLAWSPDGRWVASGSGDSWGEAEEPDDAVHVWEAAGGDEGWTRSTGYPVYELAWSPDGSRLAAGEGNGWLHAWDAASGHQLAARWQKPPEAQPSGGLLNVYPSSIDALAWSPDGQYLASARGESVVVWSMQEFAPK